MTMSRALRRLLCQALIGVMLLAQFAIAAYACPRAMPSAESTEATLSASARDEAMAVVGEDMAGNTDAATDARSMNCDQTPVQLDPASPNLCTEHCNYGQQSDHTQAPTVPVIVLSSLYIVPTVLEARCPVRATAAAAGLLSADSPSLAILHCRFRD